MNIEITQRTSKEYYEEYYSEWLSFRSKFKKWEHIIGFASLLTSITIYLADSALSYISIGLAIFGMLMIYEFYSSKNKWLKERLKSKMNNSEATLIFEDSKIRSIGPFTEMSGEWTFFSGAIETNKGLILIPENGISIYLQKKFFKNQSDVAVILKKIKEANADKK